MSLGSSFCVPLIRALSDARGSQQRSRSFRVYPYQYFAGAQSALRGPARAFIHDLRARHAGGPPLPYVRALDEALKEAV